MQRGGPGWGPQGLTNEPDGCLLQGDLSILQVLQALVQVSLSPLPAPLQLQREWDATDPPHWLEQSQRSLSRPNVGWAERSKGFQWE